MMKQSASFVLAFASFVWAVVPVYGVPVGKWTGLDTSPELEAARQQKKTYEKARGASKGLVVPSADSVPIERIRPYTEKLRQLKPVKRGFEVIGAILPNANVE